MNYYKFRRRVDPNVSKLRLSIFATARLAPLEFSNMSLLREDHGVASSQLGPFSCETDKKIVLTSNPPDDGSALNLITEVPTRKRLKWNQFTYTPPDNTNDEVAKEKSMQFVKSELRDSKYSVLQKANALLDYLETKGIKHLVFDWDLTILCTHSGGFVEPVNFKNIVSSITADWIIFITEAKKRGLPFYIATFSDIESVELSKQRTMAMPGYQQLKNRSDLDSYFTSLIAGESLVMSALKELGLSRFNNASYLLPKLVVAKYPDNYQLPDQYSDLGLKKPMKRSKSYHLEMITKTFDIQDRSSVVLFDDDSNNITQAASEGYLTVFVQNDASTPAPDRSGFRLERSNLTFGAIQ
eukprot:GHVH01001230.1.p1 GENE.GHVH01001230.1~~GHVH01001230.1.p1  ORF type:complete len:355 (+),score=43.19 GHVH01001230.1:51-1115(+)